MESVWRDTIFCFLESYKEEFTMPGCIINLEKKIYPGQISRLIA